MESTIIATVFITPSYFIEVDGPSSLDHCEDWMETAELPDDFLEVVFEDTETGESRTLYR